MNCARNGRCGGPDMSEMRHENNPTDSTEPRGLDARVGDEADTRHAGLAEADEAIEDLDHAVRSQAETRHFGVEDHDTLPTHGAPFFRPLDNGRRLRAGQVLVDRWRVLGPRPIGTGGMGEVWKARDVDTGHAVAIKALPRELAGNERAAATLRREAKIGRQLSHPNICQLYSFHTDAEVDFVVMEFVNGRTLQEMLAARNGKPMAWSDIESIAAQIASALDYAHNTTYTDADGRTIRGVLHGDIKPGNIMVTPSRTAKLMDFGIAREIHDAMPHPPAQTSQTPIYASPEQFSGMQITPASDVYSFTNVIYECLTGHRLVLAEGNVQYQVLHHPLRPLRNQTLDINAALAAGLAKDPTDRPASATALVTMFSGQA